MVTANAGGAIGRRVRLACRANRLARFATAISGEGCDTGICFECSGLPTQEMPAMKSVYAHVFPVLFVALVAYKGFILIG